MLDVYFKQVRSILEFAVPVWNSSLTGENILQIERIQKTALHIILGDCYKSYKSALKLTKVDKLAERRKKICFKFAKNAEKHETFSTWFKLNKLKTATRQDEPKYCRVYSRTVRYEKSPISYLTELLNMHYAKKK